jgi:hypothetical protein
MITLEAADLIEGDANTAAEVDYTINGVQEASNVVSIIALASGQLANAKATIYTTPGSTAAIIKSIILVNTGASANTVNLYVQSDGSNSRRIIPEDLSLEANGGTLILADHLYVFDSTGQLKTVAASGGTHAILDGSMHSDSVADTVTKGSLIIGNATPKWDELDIGTDNHHLVVSTDTPAWEELDISHDPTPTLGGALDAGGNDINNGGVIHLTEQADAETNVAGKGQIWVNTATPDELYFTTDADDDIAITSGAALVETGCAMLDGSEHTDTTASAVTKGDIVIGNATPAWDDLAIGSDNHYLVVATDLPNWEALDISHDTSPTLGGDLDLGQKSIVYDPTPSSDQTWNGHECTITTGENVEQWDVLYLKSDGAFWEADSTDYDEGVDNMLVLASAAIASTTGVVILPNTFVRDDAWSWTVGAQLFYGSDGALTETMPEYGTTVAYAWSATVIYFDPK